MKDATIKDVAACADVSVATVSRALNNPDSVKPKTRQTVLKAVENLGYEPNRIAQALRVKQVRSIGIIVPNITNGSVIEMTRGIYEELEGHGYSTVLFNSGESFIRESFFCSMLANSIVDGVIFTNGSGGNPPVAELGKKLPVCLINRMVNLDNVDEIIPEDEKGIRIACRHLFRLGRRKICFITGKTDNSDTRRRVAGFKDIIRELKLDPSDNYIISGNWLVKGAYQAMERLLRVGKRPTGVIAGTDIMALGAKRAIQDAGLKIPGDIALIGFDNSPDAAYFSPALTTLNYPNNLMGRLAARAILRRLDDNKAARQQIFLPLELIIRESCGYRLKKQRGEINGRYTD